MKVTRTAALALGIGVAALCFAAPAGADPNDDPCQLAVTFLCKLVITAPNLDHDVDLTQGSPTINGSQLPQLPSPTPAPGS